MSEGSPIVRMPLRVRYHECDPQGVVFNAHYLAYADMAAFEAMKTLFGAPDALIRRGLDMVVAEANLRYLAACRYDDELAVAVFVERLGTTSMVLRYVVERDGETVTEVTIRYVWVDTTTLRPTTPFPDVRETFARFTTG